MYYITFHTEAWIIVLPSLRRGGGSLRVEVFLRTPWKNRPVYPFFLEKGNLAALAYPLSLLSHMVLREP
jgi:hypothetical protein